ncbi:MAG: hypothetical protein Q9159_001549 [Coniocarpon cinnabarinum]
MSGCFHPDGSPVDNIEFAVCPLQDGHEYGMCCSIENRASIDYCQRDAFGNYTGLCMGGLNAQLYRNSCSDPAWGPDCLKLCINGSGKFENGSMASGDWPITACGDGTYCCGQGANGTTCCQQQDGYYIVNNTGVKNKPSTLTPTDLNTSPLSSSSSDQASRTSSSTTKAGPIVGGVIGGLVLGALLAAVAFFFYLRTFKKKHPVHAPSQATYYADQKVGIPDFQYNGTANNGPVEAPNHQRPSELPGQDETK